MEKTRSRKKSTSNQVVEQSANTSGQEKPEIVINESNDVNISITMPKDTDTTKDKENKPDVLIENPKPKKLPNVFVLNLANRIMVRIYELYGYSIKGKACKSIMKHAKHHADIYKIAMKTDIDTINTHELYDHIVQLLSNGYNPLPLDTNYNDIFIRAIVERYKI
jgi:hypothetical protein